MRIATTRHRWNVHGTGSLRCSSASPCEFILRVALLACVLWLCGQAQARAPLVLLTDFGTQDGAVAAMKGVAYSVSQDLLISDLSHENPSIFAGAYRLYQAEQFWPQDTVFVAVVDPGVGTSALVGRPEDADRPLLRRSRTTGCSDWSPNGTVSRNCAQIDESLNRRKGSDESHTFHGRDVFAYTGARLAAGVIRFEQVGPTLAPQMLISIPYRKPERAGKHSQGNHSGARRAVRQCLVQYTQIALR